MVLGLLVGAGGNPIDYEMHRGNKYEGETLIPIIEKMEHRFGLDHPTVIADAGLLNKTNITELEAKGYTYKKEAQLVHKAAGMLADDIERVSGIRPEVATRKGKGCNVVITASATEELPGWESYRIASTDNEITVSGFDPEVLLMGRFTSARL